MKEIYKQQQREQQQQQLLSQQSSLQTYSMTSQQQQPCTSSQAMFGASRSQINSAQPQQHAQNITQILNNISTNFQETQPQHLVDHYQQNFRAKPPSYEQVIDLTHDLSGDLTEDAQQSQEQQSQLAIFNEFSESIRICNSSDSVHKSNVRHLLDSIEQALDGPQLM